MQFWNGLGALFGRVQRKANAHSRTEARRLGRRPSVELMESRLLLSRSAVSLSATEVLDGYEVVSNQVLVQFRDCETQPARLSAKSKLVGVLEVHGIDTGAACDGGDLQLVSLRSGISINEAIRSLRRDPAVLFAEPNYVYKPEVVPNDPNYTNGSLWGMYGDLTSPANQYGSQAGELWQAGYVGSDTVYVGVIDEGVQVTHPDLNDNMWTNPFDPVDGVDNDGNGYRDDTNGWDFFNNDNSVYDGGTAGTQDRHGTHVAGTIGAEGNNATGVVGVNWNVTMISAKFLGPGGGTTLGAIRSVDYFTDLKRRHGLNIVATSNSWGGGGFSQALLDAITRGANENILFIAAAGNNGSNNNIAAFYPANYNTTAGAGYDAVISVAAIDRNGALAGFSNYGSTTVDLGAPGVSILSTIPFSRYGSLNGTSMATPHVSGGAAIYASTHPGASALTIKNAILNAATPTTSLTGRTVTGGRLNVSSFLADIISTDLQRLEGSGGGTTPFRFPIRLTAPSLEPVTLSYSTTNGTARAPGDYGSIPSTYLTFAPGETTKTITVDVVADDVFEPNETFFVNTVAPIPLLDQKFDGSPPGAQVSRNVSLGQTFTAGATGILDRVTVNVSTSSNDIILDVRPTVSGTPVFADSSAYTSVVLPNTNGVATDVTVSLASAAIPVRAGDVLAIVIRAPGLVGFNWSAEYDAAATYGGGAGFQRVPSTSPWTLNFTSDYDFETYVKIPANANILQSRTMGTIIDDDAPTTVNVSVSGVTEIEGTGGLTAFDFLVSLDTPSNQIVQVDFETADDTAQAGSDYIAVPRTTLVFQPGETSQVVTVFVDADFVSEPTESFFVTLSAAVNATISTGQAKGTILNDDAEIVIDDVSKFEGTGGGFTPFTFTVSLKHATVLTVTVDAYTLDGTATAPDDYETLALTTLVFNPGETMVTVTVNVVADSFREASETFFVQLENAVNGSIADAQGMGTIVNDDKLLPPAD